MANSKKKVVKSKKAESKAKESLVLDGVKLVKLVRKSKDPEEKVKKKAKTQEVEIVIPAKKTRKRKELPKEVDPTSSGQCGSKLKLTADTLNVKERRVLATLIVANQPLTLSALAEASFKSVGVFKSNSWVRNSLRRLVRAGLVSKRGTGTYGVTAKGRGAQEELAPEVEKQTSKVDSVLNSSL